MIAFEKMRVLKLRCVISTDLMSRGVDLPDVQIVINLDLPSARAKDAKGGKGAKGTGGGGEGSDLGPVGAGEGFPRSGSARVRSRRELGQVQASSCGTLSKPACLLATHTLLAGGLWPALTQPNKQSFAGNRELQLSKHNTSHAHSPPHRAAFFQLHALGGAIWGTTPLPETPSQQHGSSWPFGPPQHDRAVAFA